jgi:hypothetical protein
MLMDGHTDGQAKLAKLIIALRNLAQPVLDEQM